MKCFARPRPAPPSSWSPPCPWRWTALVAASLALVAFPACRKSERLPPRPEELESPDGGTSAASPGADAAPAPAGPPRRLSAPARPAAQRVELHTADGVTLIGDYFPAPAAGAPVVVLVHGANGRRLDFQGLVDRILPTPTARPALLAFDLRGHGESVHAGKRTLDARTLQDNPAAGVASWSGTIEDVKTALAWLRARPEIGRQAVIVGVDVGAVAAVRAAAEAAGPADERAQVVGLVGLSPAEEHGVAFGTRAFPVLAARDVQAVAVAAEDDTAEPPQGVRAIEAGLGTARADAEVFKAGGHGVELLERRPEVAARVLGFLRRTLGGSVNFGLTTPDGAVLRGAVDLSLDPGGPAVILVHDVGHDRTSLRKLRAVLVDKLPFDIVSFDLPGYGQSQAPSAGADGGEAGAPPAWSDDVPPDDPRSWRTPVRDLEALARVVAGGGDVESGEGLHFIRRSVWALVGVGLGGTIAAEAAAELVEDVALPRLAALALVSPIANVHGMSIWPALGDHLLPHGVGVFAAAGSRALMTVEDEVDGMGSAAKTVRTIAAMFRGAADTRIYTTDAHADVLINVQPDLAPSIARFLIERLGRAVPGAAAGAGDAADRGAGSEADGGASGDGAGSAALVAGDAYEPTVIPSDAAVGVLPRGVGGVAAPPPR